MIPRRSGSRIGGASDGVSLQLWVSIWLRVCLLHDTASFIIDESLRSKHSPSGPLSENRQALRLQTSIL